MTKKQFDLKDATTQPGSGGRWWGLMKLLTGYRLLYLAAICVVGLSALGNTGIYLLISQFVDDVLPLESYGNLLPLYALGVVGLALVQGFFSYLSGRWAGQVSERVAQRLRDYLYDHLQKLSFTQHDRIKVGEMLARTTSDVDTIRKVFAEQAVGFGRIFFLFIVSFTALAMLNFELALYSTIIIPVLLITSYIFFIQIGKRYEEFQKQESKLTSRLQETLAGVRVVRAFARQDFERDRFAIENEEKWRAGLKLTRAHAMFWPSTDLLSGAQVVLSLYIAGTMVINNDITLGQFIASIGLVNQLIWPVRNVGRLLSEISMGLVSYGRVNDILLLDREASASADSIAPSGPLNGNITFENVSFRYEGEGEDALPTVLHDISFSVEAGQTVALLGSTGSGKTSLINLLARFYDYEDGTITLDGVPLNNYPRDYIRQQIGIVMQEPILFAATIMDNIKYGAQRTVTDEEVFEATRAAAVHDVILDFPKGYDTVVGERGVTLSGGQKQRLTIARTILKQPALLILDDATSAVDTETESRIRDALLSSHDSSAVTSFIIAHRIQSVMHADLILVMDDGRIIERGTHASLLAHKGTYSHIYALQAGIEDDLEAEIRAAEDRVTA